MGAKDEHVRRHRSCTWRLAARPAPTSTTATGIRGCTDCPAAQQQLIAIWRADRRSLPRRADRAGLRPAQRADPAFSAGAAVQQPAWSRCIEAHGGGDSRGGYGITCDPGRRAVGHNFSVFGPPFDKNVMYTFHKYWTATGRAVVIKRVSGFPRQVSCADLAGRIGREQG